MKDEFEVNSFSSIDPFRKIPKMLGFVDEKTDDCRRFLSNLKKLSIESNDYPTNYLLKKLEVTDKNSINFFHIREASEIEKLTNLIKVESVLIERDNIEVPNNESDKDVYNWSYSVIIENNNDLKMFKDSALTFCEEFIGE